MKRISVAEKTLKKQIDALDIRLHKLGMDLELLNQEIQTTESIQDQLRLEQYNLRNKRESAHA